MSDGTGLTADAGASRVLLVEDSPEDARVVCEMFASGGTSRWRLETVGSLTAASERLEKLRPALVLLDLDLPDSRGLDTLRSLLSRAPGIPVVVLAGVEDEELGAEAVALGAEDFLAKGSLTAPALMRSLRYSKERSRLKLELGEKEDYYRSVLHSLHEDIMIVDPEYRITDVNNSFLKSVGAARESVIGRFCYEVSHKVDHPCDGGEAGCPLREVLETGETRSGNHVHMGEEGEERHVVVVCSPLRDRGGRVVRVIEAIHDVSDLYLSQEALRRSERHYRTLVDNLCAGVVVHAADTSVLSSNMRASELLGLSEDQMRGKTAIDPAWCFLREDGTAMPLEEYPVRQVISGGGPVRDLVVGVHRPDERTVWVLCNAFPMPGSKGQLDHVVVTFVDITDRKAVEERVQWLASFPSENPSPVMRFTLDGRLLYCNTASAPLLKAWHCSAEEPLSGPFRGELARVVGAGRAQIVEFRVGQVCYSATITPFAAAGYVNVYAMDVTARRHAEEDMRESEQRYRSVFENAAEGILVADLASREVSHANGAICRMLGYSRDELLGMDIAALHPSEALEHVLAEFEAQARGAKSLAEDIPCLRKDGTIIQTNIVTTAMVLDGRRCNVGFFADVTAYREAQRRLKALMNNLPGMACRCRNTPERTMLFVSKGCRKLTGYEPEDLVEDAHLSFNELIHPDDRQLVSDTVRAALEEHSPYQVTYRITTASGDQRWVWERGAGLAQQAGQGPVLEGLIVDVSDRVRAEMMIRNLNRELERRVNERTAELSVANRELESFAYSVSHDLRAPLRGIDGFSQALLDDCAEQLDEGGRHHLARIRRAVGRMGDLIDDLLALSQITRRGMAFQVVDLSAMAEDVSAEVAAGYPDRSAEVLIQPGLQTRGDPVLLRAVLQNLLDNAWKFTGGQSGACIEFGTVEPSECGVFPVADGEVAFRLRDNGAGFDMRYADKLFGAFQRLHSAEEFPGTGIGLATVQRIIHRHGGAVGATGSVGEGASFYFKLPADEAARAAKRAPQQEVLTRDKNADRPFAWARGG